MPKTVPKAPPGSKVSVSDLAEKKLESSGLDMQDARELGIEVLGTEAVVKLGFDLLPALKINYYGLDGSPMSDHKKCPPFYRLRYLSQPNDFSKLTEKPLRYTQPANTVCCAYFPKNTDWMKFLGGGEMATLILTEGELKAACACKFGFPTIGLGGVYNWRALNKGVEFLPELEMIKWARRRVLICFDSDYKTNPMVCAALKSLGDELEARGAYVAVVSLPTLAAGVKTGLDDFLVAKGPESFLSLLQQAKPLGLTKVLFDLNEKYTYVHDPGMILEQKTGFKATPGAFKEHKEAVKGYHADVMLANGEIVQKKVSAAASWLTWPLRREVSRLTYIPGQPQLLPDGQFNIWKGWGVEPKKGDVKPFLKLIDHIFIGAEPEAKKWFMQWCAYPLQNPGTKLFQSAVFHGIHQGTGKSLIGYTLGRIYGKNFVEIGQASLHGSFNEWAEAKQFVMGDDVTGSNKRADADMLKKLITQREMAVNIKYVPSYTVPDCINYFFNSNHPDPFFLDDDDRRYFIHEVQVEPLDEKFYLYYAGQPGKPETSWLDTGGSSAVFDYLLKLDMKGFNPAGAAFKTAARARMIAGTQSDLGAWVRRLIATPEHVLKVGEIEVKKDLFTNRELLEFYDPLRRTGTTHNGLGRELTRAGIPQAVQGHPLKLTDGTQDRYYIVRNVKDWADAQPTRCKEHIEKFNGRMGFPQKEKF